MKDYAFPEPAYLQRLLVPRGDRVAGEVAALVEECFVDLYRVVRDHFVGVRGLGLKQVAAAAGFAWRDDDPGGAQSQVWLDELRAGGDPVLKRRLLAYDEDDVRATWWVRERLLDPGRDGAVPVARGVRLRGVVVGARVLLPLEVRARPVESLRLAVAVAQAFAQATTSGWLRPVVAWAPLPAWLRTDRHAAAYRRLGFRGDPASGSPRCLRRPPRPH